MAIKLAHTNNNFLLEKESFSFCFVNHLVQNFFSFTQPKNVSLKESLRMEIFCHLPHSLFSRQLNTMFPLFCCVLRRISYWIIGLRSAVEEIQLLCLPKMEQNWKGCLLLLLMVEWCGVIRCPLRIKRVQLEQQQK